MAGNWTNCCNYNFTFHCNVLSIGSCLKKKIISSVVYTWYSISVIALSFYYYYFSIYYIIMYLLIVYYIILTYCIFYCTYLLYIIISIHKLDDNNKNNKIK